MRVEWRHSSQAALLALLPMGMAAAGAALDERTKRGFTLWRDACRAAGVTLASLLNFTVTLLPGAVTGLLLGSLVILLIGASDCRGGRMAHTSLAAHLGCLLGMAAGMLLCVTLLPLSSMLVIEPVLVLAIAIGASVRPRTGALASA